MSRASPSPSTSQTSVTPASTVNDVWAKVQAEYRIGDVINTGRDGTVLRYGNIPKLTNLA